MKTMSIKILEASAKIKALCNQAEKYEKEVGELLKARPNEVLLTIDFEEVKKYNAVFNELEVTRENQENFPPIYYGLLLRKKDTKFAYITKTRCFMFGQYFDPEKKISCDYRPYRILEPNVLDKIYFYIQVPTLQTIKNYVGNSRDAIENIKKDFKEKFFEFYENENKRRQHLK